MPSLIVSCHAVFGSYRWEVCSFLRGNGESVDLGEGEVWGGRRRGRRGGCGQDIVYEKNK